MSMYVGLSILLSHLNADPTAVVGFDFEDSAMPACSIQYLRPVNTILWGGVL